MVFHDFSGFEPLKNDPKSMQKRIRKKYRKKLPKNRRWPPFWPPKTSENRSQIPKNRSAKRRGTKPVSRRYGTRAQIVGSQRGPAFVNRPKGYAYD